ncbi:threonine--tRNA ligase [Clostridiales bacterium COT073_COT-073]|nr:threonine--tRNA ligase [Clostridiales bacterium COT073_COT-073]
MKITLKDGSIREYEQPMAIIDIVKDISEGLANVATLAEVDGVTMDLRKVIDQDCSLHVLTAKDEKGLAALRHSCSHVLAQAVKRLYPEAKLAIGPATENGFYYDFDKEPAFKDEDLPAIEKEMKKIIKERHNIKYFELPRAEAIALMEQKNEPYKVELINDLPEDAVISFYEQGEFVDLCAGPHVMNIKAIKAFKLISTAGAYWRGSEKNKMLSRIYATAFETKEELQAYLTQLEEAKKRDHNKLGRELGYFMTSEVVGQGLPLLMPKGAKLFQILQRYTEDLEMRSGYEFTKTPYMAKSDLYKISGHWSHYKDGMFVLGEEGKDDEVLALRPMTCPFQYLIYKATQHSYRDLPVRLSETSTLFRNESSGEMHGLIRVRQFTLADAHIICTPEQLEQEFKSTVNLLHTIMTDLGIADKIWYRFSKWDPNNKEKYIDEPEAWENTQNLMRDILNHIGLKFTEADDEAAFYGPKLDLQFKNVHGKQDTLLTIQIDFALARRFDMTYVDADNTKKHPYIVHRSSIGCYERTMAMLIEEYAGALPLWLSPVQALILPISDKYIDYANELKRRMEWQGLRVQVDTRSESIGYKIRAARGERVPYMLIVGEEEEKADAVAVRSREKGEEGVVSVDELIKRLVEEDRSKYIYHKHMSQE